MLPLEVIPQTWEERGKVESVRRWRLRKSFPARRFLSAQTTTKAKHMQNSQAPIQKPQVQENECASSSWGCCGATQQAFFSHATFQMTRKNKQPWRSPASASSGLWVRPKTLHLSTKVRDSVKMTQISEKKKKNRNPLDFCPKNLCKDSRKNFLCTEGLGFNAKKKNLLTAKQTFGTTMKRINFSHCKPSFRKSQDKYYFLMHRTQTDKLVILKTNLFFFLRAFVK